MSDYSVMDPALELLAPYGPDLTNGLTNHAPMAAEALCALGRADAVLPWLEEYRRGMQPRPPARERISRKDWRTALGKEDRFADWSAFFAEELAEAPWRQVVERWMDRLAPAVCASAAHGVIRAGHAARSLEQAETPARRRELADGLAYWAAAYQTLPTPARPAGEHASQPRTSGAVYEARDAIGRVPIVPPAQRKFDGTIVGSLAALDEFSAFAPVIDLLDVERSAERVLSEMTETFARVYLANAHDVLTSIVFVHAVTGATAVRSMLPYVSPATARDALRYAWQAGCGLYAAFGTAAPAPATVEPPRAESVERTERTEMETLVDMAIASRDEHAIKFTEACLREHALAPSPAYSAAARHASTTLAAQ